MGEEVLIVVLQGLLELAVYLPWDWLLFIQEKKGADGRAGRCIGCMIVAGLLLGAAFGGVSLLAWPETALKSPGARMLNLGGTPLMCGGFAVAVAGRRAKRGAHTSAALHFWFAFIFTATLIAIRFAFADRPS